MLIKCWECGHDVSDTAKKCAYCGAKLKKQSKIALSVTDSGVDVEKTEIIAESAFVPKKIKTTFLCTVIPAYILAICFLILTVLSWAAPKIFYTGSSYNDAVKTLKDLQRQSDGSEYEYSINGNKILISYSAANGNDYLTESIFSGSSYLWVQYNFCSDGDIVVWVYCYFNSGKQYQVKYEIEEEKPVYVASYLDNKATEIPPDIKSLADSAANLTISINNYLLDSNKTYDFNDILSEYEDFKVSLNGIRISSIVLSAVFLIVSTGIIVVYVLLKKNKINLPVKNKNKTQKTETSENLSPTSVETAHKPPILTTNAETSENKINRSLDSVKSFAETLKLYKELLDEGIITQEEFDKKKTKILSEK